MSNIEQSLRSAGYNSEADSYPSDGFSSNDVFNDAETGNAPEEMDSEQTDESMDDNRLFHQPQVYSISGGSADMGSIKKIDIPPERAILSQPKSNSDLVRQTGNDWIQVEASKHNKTLLSSDRASRVTILDEPSENQSKSLFGDKFADFNPKSFNPPTESQLATLHAQQQQQLFVLLLMSFTIFIIIGLIIYNWFYRNRGLPSRSMAKRRSSASLSLRENLSHYHPSLAWLFGQPTFYTGERSHKSAHQEEEEFNRQTDVRVTSGRSSNGEFIQLDKRPTLTPLEAQEDSDIIRIEQCYEPMQSKSANASIVIFKQKIAQSALVLAVKPRLSKATKKLRSFIDQEASDIRSKAANPNNRLETMTRLFGIPKASTSCRETELLDVEQAGQEQIGSGSPEHQERANDVTCSQANHLSKVKPNCNKSSPSPAAPNEACSSISVCSLFSESPINDHQLQPLIAATSTLSNMDFKTLIRPGGSTGSCTDRVSVAPSLLRPNEQRSCCSVSPSAMQQAIPLFSSRAVVHESSPTRSHLKPLELERVRAASVVDTHGPGYIALAPPNHYLTCNNDQRAQEVRSAGSIAINNGFYEPRMTGHTSAPGPMEMARVCVHKHIASTDQNTANSFCSANQSIADTSNLAAFESHRDDSGRESQFACDCNCNLNENGEFMSNRHDHQSALDSTMTNYAHVHPAYLESRSACSIGEVPSSGSTSLGGSDSGFGPTSSIGYPGSANLCQVGSAYGQYKSSNSGQNPAMNILVQQPSTTSFNSHTTIAGREPPEELHKFRSNDLQRARWTPRTTRLRPAGLGSSPMELRYRHHCSFSNPIQPRRMSIAGDRVGLCQTNLAATHDENTMQIASAIDRSSILHHRASIASADQGSRNLQAIEQRSTRLGSNPTEPRRLFASPRPSDASLYDPPGCSCIDTSLSLNLSNKSYNGSSGGSSSGIGFSSSACTNTPTSMFPQLGRADLPVSSVAQRPPSLTELACACHQPELMCLQYGVNRNTMNQFNESIHYPLTAYPVSCGPNRKFSLPVHLESQVIERSPAARTGLLFDENLQHINPASQASSPNPPVASSPQPARQRTIEELACNQTVSSLCTSVRCDTLSGMANSRSSCQSNHSQDNRRSSQTITRQSSFWLDDDDSSVNSIMSNHHSTLDVTCKTDRLSESDAGNYLCVTRETILDGPVEEKEMMAGLTRVQPETQPKRPKGAYNPSQAPSTSASGQEKRMDPLRVTPRRGRLSSSSTTSSAGSSPSPDSARRSERILARQLNSSSISKRNLFIKLRSRKQSKPHSSSSVASKRALTKLSSSGTTAQVASEFGLDLTNLTAATNTSNDLSPTRDTSNQSDKSSKKNTNKDNCDSGSQPPERHISCGSNSASL